MRSAVLTKVVSVVLIAIFPPATIASDSVGAIVVPGNTVSVNGVSIDRSQAVFRGDSIQTSDAGASLIQTGAVVQLGPKSAITWAPESLVVRSGGISVTTTRQLQADLYDVQAKPQTSEAQYVIATFADHVTIGAKKGILKVTDGSYTVVIPEGEALVAPIESAASQDTAQDKQKTPSTQEGTVVVDVPAKTRVALSKGKLVAIVVALAGVGIAVAVLATRKKSASPSAP